MTDTPKHTGSENDMYPPISATDGSERDDPCNCGGTMIKSHPMTEACIPWCPGPHSSMLGDKKMGEHEDFDPVPGMIKEDNERMRSKSQEKRHAALKGIPPATEDDLKLDLVGEYRIGSPFYQAVIRLAHHHQQETERRKDWVDPLDPDFKMYLKLDERITTLEKQLDTAESALDDYTDKALKLEAALRETLPFFRSVIQGREFWTATCEQAYKRAMSEVSDTEENPTKHEYRRCPMCGRCAECGEENPTDD